MATPKKQPTPAQAAVIDAPHKPAAASKPRGHAGGKVIVCSKLSNALELRVDKPVMVTQRYKQESWQEPVFVQDGPTIIIAGNNYPIGAPPEGVIWPDRPAMTAGYAMTFGVDADFWDTWLEQHKTMDIVVNELIFAEENVEDAKAHAIANRARETGLGPLRPDNDKRMPKKTRVNPMQRSADEADQAAAE